MTGYTVSLFVVEALRSIGVKRVYGLIGTSVLDFFDSLYDYRDRIRLVTVRHEQAAIAMADAEYRASGNLAVAAVHAGPGFLNTLLGLGIAFKDKVPLLLVSGGVRRRFKGLDSLHEVDQVSIASPITKMSVRLSSGGELPHLLKELLRRAYARPRGPVMLEVPEDLWLEPVDADPRDIKLSELLEPPRHPSRDEVLSVVKLMAKAERPLIMVCGEALNGPDKDVGKMVEEMAERLGAYIVTSGSARGACDEFNPRCLGRVGFGGGSLPAIGALEESDAVLVLGDELDDIATHGYTATPSREIVVVSENPIVDKRPLRYTLKVNCDPSVFAKYMLEALRAEGIKTLKPSWDDVLTGYLSSWTSLVDEALSRKYVDFVNPSKFFKTLSERLPEKCVVTAGQGVHILYAYVFMKFRPPRKFLAATRLGAMGYAFPAALGAKLALPDYEVISIVGDGDFMMTVQELETAIRERIPVKVVIVNDMSYRVLLLRQKLQKGGRIIGTLLGSPPFEELAKVFKAEGLTVTKDEDIDYAVKTVLESDKPFLLDLRISQEDVPPIGRPTY